MIYVYLIDDYWNLKIICVSFMHLTYIQLACSTGLFRPEKIKVLPNTSFADRIRANSVF